MTTSIVLFRCHAHASVCANRISLLRTLNPDVRIYSLFGGIPEAAGELKTVLGNFIDGWYSTERPKEWNWRHGDLAVRKWFLDGGCKVSFGRLYLVEWDLLLLNSLRALYRHVPPDAVAVTAKFPLRDVAHDWGWMTNATDREEWSALLSLVARDFGYSEGPYASLGPGTCYSREFLERYCSIDIPELTNDEQRVPLFAQCFGITVSNTGFRQTWDDPQELLAFNCQNAEICPTVIHSELSKPNGRRVFHPFRRIWPPEDIG